MCTLYSNIAPALYPYMQDLLASTLSQTSRRDDGMQTLLQHKIILSSISRNYTFALQRQQMRQPQHTRTSSHRERREGK